MLFLHGKAENLKGGNILICLHGHLLLSLENMTPRISHKAGFENKECPPNLIFKNVVANPEYCIT